MNTKEKELVKMLENMQRQFGVLGVKAEFEAEGTRDVELLRLKDIAAKAGVILALKIGGPEDVWGIRQARQIGVSEIVAPMVEGPYALVKFLDAFRANISADEREDTVAAVNVETEQSYDNIDKIIKTGVSGGLHGVTVGRVDLVGSMGLKRDSIDSPKVFRITKAICEKAKKAGLRTVMGGGIEKGSKDFVGKLVDAGVLDRFETRKVIFDAKRAIGVYEEAVKTAHLFDKIWLLNKQDYYTAIAAEDAHRFPMLDKRIAG